MTFQQFAARHHITMTSERTADNPLMDHAQDMDHWKCRLVRRATDRRHSLTIVFSMGYGHRGKAPKVADVLECLSSDASTVINAGSFEDWASELGYDSDSRKAQRTFDQTDRQTTKLRRFLGESIFEQLLRVDGQ